MRIGQDIFLPTVLLTLIGGVGPIASLARAMETADSEPLLVVGWDAAALVAEAEGRPVGLFSTSLVTLATGGEGFVESLKEGGAWAVLDGREIASLCGWSS